MPFEEKPGEEDRLAALEKKERLGGALDQPSRRLFQGQGDDAGARGGPGGQLPDEAATQRTPLGQKPAIPAQLQPVEEIEERHGTTPTLAVYHSALSAQERAW